MLRHSKHTGKGLGTMLSTRIGPLRSCFECLSMTSDFFAIVGVIANRSVRALTAKKNINNEN